MEMLTTFEVFQVLCKSTKQWGLYISSSNDESWAEINKAAPYLDAINDASFFLEGCRVILCDSKEEALELFWQTVGDDGPTLENPYNGPARVYACVCGPDGKFTHENT